MAKKFQKVLFYAYPHPTAWLVFNDGTKDWVWGFWAWGKTDKKFILKKLVEKHGIKLGKEIYKAYNQALLDLMESGYTKQRTAALVFYLPSEEGEESLPQ